MKMKNVVKGALAVGAVAVLGYLVKKAHEKEKAKETVNDFFDEDMFENDAHDDSGKCGKKCTRECPARFFDVDGHEVDGHRVKNGFGTA